MSLATIMALSLPGGVVLGLVYFSWLRWSVRRVLQFNGSPFTTIVALACRLALAAAVFLLAVSSGGWPAALVTFAGFLLARTAVTWRRAHVLLERYS